MKRAVAGLVFAVVASIAVALPAGPALAARAAIIVDVHTGAVLYQKHADRRHHPASLTKMMTLYLLFEALDEGRVSLDTRFRVSARAAGQPKSKLGLRKGQTIAVRDAIPALIVKSANDVATVVAEALGGVEWRFATQMMRKARELGMRRTGFRNASGLPNRRQLSTAR
ncbi:MAG: serine hydrolase, partial [Alphaproteobacteria bacterium]